MTYDAIIIGAGPGGTTAATYMADAGLRVLLLDKDRFPRDKICGDAISGKSVDVLRDLGVVERVMEAGSQASWGITFGAPSGEVVSIPFTKDEDRSVPPTFVCPRTTFDQILFERARATEAEIWQEATVEDLLWEGEQVVGVRVKRTGHGKPERLDVRAPLVVGADGAYSTVVRSLGMTQLDERYYAGAIRAYYEGVTGFHERHFMEIHFIDGYMPGYFWIFPLGDGRANVGVGMLSRAIKQRGVRLKALLAACIEHPRFRHRFEHAQQVGPSRGWGLPLGSKPRPMAGNGWLLVGDAASLIDPFSGEGIGNAMTSGRMAAQWAYRAKDAGAYSAAFLKQYERDVMSYLKDELRLSYSMQRLIRWERLLNFTVRKAARSPELSDVLTCMFDDESQRQRLLSPLFYLRLLAA
ncbi:MAG TPA: geranylgeranyl reductase family protein [Rhodothermales bacterium]|nr:geranylgeranyl reductase family protein [Rhodothermales bacterium]